MDSVTVDQEPVRRPRRYCPACGASVRAFKPGPGGRPDAGCPECGSLERHRFLALVLEALTPWTQGRRLLLDIAPSATTTVLLRRLGTEHYLRMDLDPAADARTVDLQGSVTAIPLASGSVDALVCYHVLEHVPDDAAAMAELARVLAPDGFGLVQVPWRPGTPTDEDPSAPVPERVRRFGQADHVRYYGDDFEERLEKAGLRLLRFTPGELLDEALLELFRLSPAEAVWIVRPAAGTLEVDLGQVREATLAATARLLARRLSAVDSDERLSVLEAERDGARREAARWEREYHRLRGRLPVRVMAGAGRVARAVARRVRR